ncbi:hypothetical protein ANCCAN_05143 [Ancylostoma caninum]|uniref:Uncharacterized protein n=1 Tax=Ancylostoma caninum TaxID=29170 RepID=A0A368GZT5_ANCCA|nr:hypothetical protein ANCCAN_05143 [Ancylostoma caninum]
MTGEKMGQGAHRAKGLASVAGEKLKVRAQEAKQKSPSFFEGLHNVMDVMKEMKAGCEQFLISCFAKLAIKRGKLKQLPNQVVVKQEKPDKSIFLCRKV